MMYEKTKEKISVTISKHPDGIGIYDLYSNLIEKFKNNIELVLYMLRMLCNKHLNISKVTVGKYLNSDLVYKKPI